ncbi:MAG TPA: DUF1194 domain-containing protein [Oscillatoriales cyanobacterium M4454_W2019_049]|nr:DUF1194 domain-containing protein [Oscillatoriales cyanobacterium M4454_W2019_049]
MNRTIASISTIVAAVSPTLVAFPSVAATLVNVEFVLSADVSGSISSEEFDLQRQGYVNAFRDAELIDLIAGLDRGIAVTMQYWSSSAFSPLTWHHITDAASANAFADAIAATERPGRGGTNIAAGLTSATNLLLGNEFEGDRKVIDLSADERNSCYRTCRVTMARDAAVAAGITINGLPITRSSSSSLDDYFQAYVIGGEGAFTEVASEFGDFDRAVKAKLTREIPSNPRDSVSVPEPSSTLGLLVFGCLGGRSFFKRKGNLNSQAKQRA